MSDEEYHRQLKKFVQDVRSALSIKKSFERLVQIGRRTGLTDIQIGDDIRAEFKGELPDVTIRKYLPPSFKHQEKSNIRYSDAIRVSHIQPDTFPPPEIPQDAEIIREPAKPIDQAITISTDDKQIMLDTGKFRSDLRIALINGAKVWLSYNNAKEVISINEKAN